jgi:hypothetical protein
MMEPASSKPWYHSKTIWSAVGILLLSILSALGIDTSEINADGLGELLASLASGILALCAIVARIRAKQRIE